MSLPEEFILRILRKPEEEAQRQAYPDGFPEALRIPVERYTSREFFSLEKKHVFEKCWLFVAHVQQLPEVGSYLFLEQLEGIGIPIFLLRGEDHKIRAFYNSCLHRGGPVVTDPSGTVNGRLRCAYHAWSYDTQGELRTVPQKKNFSRTIVAGCRSLKQIECETWGHFVFVRIEEGEDSLEDFLGPVIQEFEGTWGPEVSNVNFAEMRVTPVAANWKLPGDANIETYHVPIIHHTAGAGRVEAERTGQWLLPNGHSRMLVKFGDRVRFPPQAVFEGDTMLAEAGVFSYHLFPNLHFVLTGPSAGMVISCFPGNEPGECKFYTHYITAIEPTEKNARRIERATNSNHLVLLEDLEPQSHIQRSYQSRGVTHLNLQYQEYRIYHVHVELDRWIGADRVPAELLLDDCLSEYVETADSVQGNHL